MIVNKFEINKGENNLKNKKIFITISIILLIIVFLSINKIKILKILYPQAYYEIISEYSKEYNVDKNLIFALVKAESNFDKDAVSNKNAIGLMQIMEETAKDIVSKNDININNDNIKEELLNVDNNINIGTKYISMLSEKYNDIGIALAAYNAGSGNVDKWIEKGIIKNDGSDIENIPYKETNNYVRKILRDYEIYKQIY